MNLDKTLWGPDMWRTLHLLSFLYPVKPSADDKKNMKNYILALRKVLPCEICQLNFKRDLQGRGVNSTTLEMALESRDSLSRFLVDIHNTINNCNKKTVIPYDIVKQQYEKRIANSTK